MPHFSNWRCKDRAATAWDVGCTILITVIEPTGEILRRMMRNHQLNDGSGVEPWEERDWHAIHSSFQGRNGAVHATCRRALDPCTSEH